MENISQFELMMDRMLEKPESWRLMITPEGNAVLTDNPSMKGTVIGRVEGKEHWILKNSKIVSNIIRQSLDSLKSTKLFGLYFFLRQHKSSPLLRRVPSKRSEYESWRRRCSGQMPL